MAQDVKSSNINPAKNIVKVNILRANIKQTKVIDTDIVFVLEDGRTVFIRDGAVQSLLDNGFSVEFSDGILVSGQELLQSAGTAEISSVALTGPQASSNDGVIVVQAPQATVAPEVVKSSSGSSLTTWLAVGTPVVGGALAGLLGGGGGSSWNSPTLTSAVTHTAGYRSGAGLAIISYVLPPAVTTFAPASTLTNATSLAYNLVFNESVTGLTSADFATVGSTATCSLISVSGTGASYLVTATGCSTGSYRLTLLANSISGTVAGPSADAISTDVVIERTAPTVALTSPVSPNSALSFEYGLLFSESVTGLAADDFVVTGTSCEVGAVSGSVTRYTVQVTRCSDGASARLTLNANAVSDAAQNLGPASATSFATVTVNRGTIVAPVSTPAPSPSISVDPLPSQAPAQNSSPAQGTSHITPISNGGGPSGGPAGGVGGLNQISSQELIAAQPVRKTYAFTGAIKLPTSPNEEPVAIYETDTNQITIDNPTNDQAPASKNGWQQYAIIGVGGLSGLLASIGIAKGFRQMRARRLVRKFA